MSATSVLLDQLQAHYINPKDAFPGGIFVRECGLNGQTGSRVDAVYAGFTSTSGRLLVGHEVKVSRADWLRELDKAGKADTWADQCHQWWIVTTGPDIVPVAELPNGWGLLYPNPRGRRMKVIRPAVTHDDRTPSWLIMRSILARYDTLRAQTIAEERDRLRDEGNREIDRRVDAIVEQRQGSTLTREQTDRLTTLDLLEKALGVTIKAWGGTDVVRPDVMARAIRLAEGSDLLDPGRRHEGFFGERHLRDAVAHLAQGLADLDQARAEHQQAVSA